MIIKYLRTLGEDSSGLGYWVFLLFSYIKKNILFGLVNFVFMVVYSYYLSFKLFGISRIPRVCFRKGLFKINLEVKKGALAKINSGLLIFEKWHSGIATSIFLDAGSILQIDDTFSIGDNCKISVAKNALLHISGKSENQLSGVTSDTIILCSKKIEIGKGTIISWNCYFTDSSQHQFNGYLRIIPVKIGEMVWISEGVTCGPGSSIGDGSVVGSKSYTNVEYPPNSFIVGCPGKVKKSNINWKR